MDFWGRSAQDFVRREVFNGFAYIDRMDGVDPDLVPGGVVAVFGEQVLDLVLEEVSKVRAHQSFRLLAGG